MYEWYSFKLFPDLGHGVPTIDAKSGGRIWILIRCHFGEFHSKKKTFFFNADLAGGAVQVPYNGAPAGVDGKTMANKEQNLM